MEFYLLRPIWLWISVKETGHRFRQYTQNRSTAHQTLYRDRMRYRSAHLFFSRVIVQLAKHQHIPALSAGVLLVLVYLPGHPPYYIAAAELVAKIYSSSMMAVLNSRIRVISNAPALSAPLWNESAGLSGSIISTGRSRIVFRRSSQVDSSCSHALGPAPWMDIQAFY